MIKILNELGIGGTYLNIKGPYMTSPQLTSYSMVKSQNLFLCDQEKDRALLSPPLFRTVLEILTRAIGQEKGN